MPYISRLDNRRQELIDGDTARNAGELNFQIFAYVKKCGNNSICYAQIIDYVNAFLGVSPNYQKYNDLTGALICCYKELKRRLNIDCKYLLFLLYSYDKEIADYEDKKIIENGDVEV